MQKHLRRSSGRHEFALCRVISIWFLYQFVKHSSLKLLAEFDGRFVGTSEYIVKKQVALFFDMMFRGDSCEANEVCNGASRA